MPESSPDVVLEFGASFDMGENAGGLFRLAPIGTDDYDGDNSDSEAVSEVSSPPPSSSPKPRRISSCRTIRESMRDGSPSDSDCRSSDDGEVTESPEIKLYRRALGSAEEHYGPDNALVGAAAANLGVALYRSGRFSGAEAAFRRALAAAEANLLLSKDSDLSDSDASDVASPPSAADNETMNGTITDALRSTTSSTTNTSSSQSLTLAPSSAPSITPSPSQTMPLPQPPASLVGSLLSTPPTQLQDGMFDAGTKHSDALLAAVSGLARSLYRQRLFEKAEPIFRRAAAVAGARHGARSTAAGVAVNCLARALDRLGRRAEAKVFHRRVRDSCSAAASEGHKFLLSRQPEDALPLLRRALVLTEAMKGPQHSATSKALTEVAKCLASEGEYDSALPLFRRALSILDAGGQNNSSGMTLRGFTNDGELKYPSASSSTVGMAVPSAANAERVSVLNGFASALYQTGSYAAAETQFRRASTSASTLHGDAAHPQAVAAAESASLCHALSVRAAISLEVLVVPTTGLRKSSLVGDVAHMNTNCEGTAENGGDTGAVDFGGSAGCIAHDDNGSVSQSHESIGRIQNSSTGSKTTGVANDDSNSDTHSTWPVLEGLDSDEPGLEFPMQKVDVPWAPLVTLPPPSNASSASQVNLASSTSEASYSTCDISVEASLNPFFENILMGDHLQRNNTASAPTAVAGSNMKSSWSLKLVAAEPIWAHVPLSNGQVPASSKGNDDTPAMNGPVVASPSLQGCAALVSRGRGPFHEKVDRCARAGALAVLVMNDDEERPDAALSMAAPPDYTSPVPAMMISWRDGCKLLSHLDSMASFPAPETIMKAAYAMPSASLLCNADTPRRPSSSMPSQPEVFSSISDSPQISGANSGEGQALDGIVSSAEVVVVFRQSATTSM